MMKRKLLVGLTTIALTASQLVMADIYRYKDENGITVLNRQGVPAKYIANGYEVLNDAGRVVRIVPRALTGEELIEQKRLEAQEASDVQLVRLYPTSRDLERAKGRQITDIDGQISTLKNNLLGVQSKREDLQKRAAEAERAGRQVSANTLSELQSLERDKTVLEAQVAQYEDQKEKLLQDFAEKAVRIKELTGK